MLALSEPELPEASRELAYGAPALERAACRATGKSGHALRRHELARRALARI